MRIAPYATKFNRMLLASTILVAGHVSANAQAILDPSTWLSTGPEGDKQRQQELKQDGSTREYKPMQFGLWLVESSVSVGSVFDSNIYSTRTNTKSATGLSISPSIVGRYTDGGQNSTFYLDGSARHFNLSEDLTTFGGRFGFGHSVEIDRGTVWKALVQAGRAQDDLGAFNATGAGADGSGVYVKPINSNSLFAATSILSRLNYSNFSGFWSGGVSANITRFEEAELSDGSKIDQDARDSNAYTATGRVGWNVAPVVYAFLEPSVGLQQNPNVSDADSTTYRLTAGLGTDRINLMRGEVFAGYSRQSFNDLSGDPEQGAVFGGRLSWFPTRDVTLNFTADDGIGITSSSTGGTTEVFSSHIRNIAADLNYVVDQRVTFSVRSSYSTIDFGDTDRSDDVMRYGADLNYMVTGNMGVRVGFTGVDVESTDQTYNVDRTIYSIALNARF